MSIQHLAGLPNAEKWPTPLEILDIMDAIDSHKTRVYISGKPFNIKYKENDQYWISPVEGYAPCGYFNEDDFREYRKG